MVVPEAGFYGDVVECLFSTRENLVRPVLEYGSSVRDPHAKGHQEELEKV